VQRALFAAVTFAGCYAPSVAPGVPCGNECPYGFTCIAHACVTSTGDEDGDGVANLVDNCPAAANPDQHDEDHDGLGDACDPCPYLPGGSEDADGDGVGDACDPEPQVARQRWVVFDPFTAPRPAWSFQDGSTVEGDAMHARGYSSLQVPTGELRIVAGGNIAGVTATEHSLTISFDSDPSGTRYYYCEFYDAATSDGNVSISSANGSTFTTIASTGYQKPLPSGAWTMQVDESVSAQHIAFATLLAGTPRPPVSAERTSLAFPMIAGDHLGLFVKNATVTVDYFGVIATTP